MMITSNPLMPETLNRVPISGTPFEKHIGVQQAFSLFLYFSQAENKVFYTWKDSVGGSKALTCDVPIDKKNFSFFIKTSGNLVSLNYHDNTSNNYSKCAVIDMGTDKLTNFYISMLARCKSRIRYFFLFFLDLSFSNFLDIVILDDLSINFNRSFKTVKFPIYKYYKENDSNRKVV